MFKVALDNYNGIYEVRFFHLNPANSKHPLKCSGTLCLISSTGRKIATGHTVLHSSDKNKYCKETGRKLSLQRALKDFPFTKEERKLFWDKYFETKGHK